MRSTIPSRRRLAKLKLRGTRVAAVTAALALTALLGSAVPAGAQTTPLYPDLKMGPPSELHHLEREAEPGGPLHHFLHFSTRIKNLGQGALELHQTPNAEGTQAVTQRIYESPAGFRDVPVGTNALTPFAFPVPSVARYEVWLERDYLRALARNFTRGGPLYTRDDVSYCVADGEQFDPNASPVGVYASCNRSVVGISVGWNDLTSWFDDFQSVDFGTTMPPDGEYVIRAVADPQNLLFESNGKQDAARESHAANAAVSYFRVANGRLAGIGG